jgi:hypothetical protein
LGPALLLAVAIAGQSKRSEVLICTDGLSNVGVGSLEGVDKEKGAEFYVRVGGIAKKTDTTINVLSIEGSDCAMDCLSRCAEMTSGMLYPPMHSCRHSALMNKNSRYGEHREPAGAGPPDPRHLPEPGDCHQRQDQPLFPQVWWSPNFWISGQQTDTRHNLVARRSLGWRALPVAEKAGKKKKEGKKAKVSPFFEYDVGNATTDTDLTFAYAVKQVRRILGSLDE